MIASLDYEFVRKNIASEKSMYGGNLYFITPIIVMLVLHQRYIKKEKV